MAVKEDLVWITLSPRNMSYFENLHYDIPKIKNKRGKMTTPRGTKIEVKVCDLNDSNVLVTKICDICKVEIKNQKYSKIVVNRRDGDGIDRCKNCGSTKVWEIRTNNIPPEKNLKYKYPHIFNELHLTKNGNFEIDKIFTGSAVTYWWICPNNLDHDYEAKVISRTACESGCPYCSGNKVNHTNCLAITHPNLITEWNYLKNNEFSPFNISAGSNRLVWWSCPDCNSSYDMSTNCRTNQNQDCPYCRGIRVNHTNCLSTTHSELSKEWHPTKNGELTTYNITSGSHEEAWWICKENHEWKAQIKSRALNNRGCKTCYLQNNSGENHPCYNHELTEEERVIGRNISGYVDWRNAVFIRDNFTCQCCEIKGSGNLNSHHKDGYNWCVNGRIDINNGITLCEVCHVLDEHSFHRIYGKGDNTKEQFDEWMLNYKNYFVLKNRLINLDTINELIKLNIDIAM